MVSLTICVIFIPSRIVPTYTGCRHGRYREVHVQCFGKYLAATGRGESRPIWLFFESGNNMTFGGANVVLTMQVFANPGHRTPLFKLARFDTVADLARNARLGARQPQNVARRVRIQRGNNPAHHHPIRIVLLPGSDRILLLRQSQIRHAQVQRGLDPGKLLPLLHQQPHHHQRRHRKTPPTAR